MNDAPDLAALLRAIADAEAAVPPETTALLPPDMRNRYDVIRRDLAHLAMRVHALRLRTQTTQHSGG